MDVTFPVQDACSATQQNEMGAQPEQNEMGAQPFFLLGLTQSECGFPWRSREVFSWMKLFSCVHHPRMFLAMEEQKEAQKKKIPCCFLIPEKAPAQPQPPDGTAYALGIADEPVLEQWAEQELKPLPLHS